MSLLANLEFFFFAGMLFFVLVFVHELGHFLMARWMGVKVERFSIGMGPAIFKKTWGDTEYRLAILPLGGYVKMAGDDPSKTYSEAEKKIGFLTQTPPKKLVIVFGGPVFNLILPILIFAFLLAVGIPETSSVVGIVEEGKPAAQAGLMPGDRIVKINGEEIRYWTKLEESIRASANKELQLEVARMNLQSGQEEMISTKLTPELSDGKTRLGEDVKVGKAWFGPYFRQPAIYFEGESALKAAGVQKFDLIQEVDGVRITTLEQLRAAIEAQGQDGKLVLKGLRGEVNPQPIEFEVAVPPGGSSVQERLAMRPAELVVGEVSQTVEIKDDGKSQEVAGPAYLAGLRAGDRLVSIDGKTLTDWSQVMVIIQEAQGRDFVMTWSRDGEEMSASLRAKSTVLDDPMLGKDNPLVVNASPRIGVGPMLKADTTYVVDQSWNPITLIERGLTETWSMISLTGQAIGKLVTGQLSLKALGSPIMIFKVAGNSYRLAGGGQRGWTALLKTLAFLSVSLGLMNLLPIPVLDGGHAVFFTLEWIRRRPLSLKTIEVSTQIGMVVILGLIVMVLFNDIYRYEYWDKFINYFR